MMMIISIIFCVSLSISALVLVTWLVPIIAVLPLYFVLGKFILVIIFNVNLDENSGFFGQLISIAYVKTGQMSAKF